MKIGYVLGFFPKLSETFILNEIIELKRCGHDVVIFSLFHPEDRVIHPEVQKYGLLKDTFYLQNPKKLLNQIKLGLKSIGFFGWKYPSESLKSKIFCITSAKYFSKIAKDLEINILHAHFNGAPAHTAMLIAKKLEVPFTFTTHAFDIFVNRNVQALRTRIENSFNTITESAFHKNYLRELTGINDEKIKIIHICPDLDKINKIKKEEKRIRNNDRKINLITVSRLVEKKGIKYAILAVKKILQEAPELQYIIVGDGPLKSELVTLIRKLKLEKNIRIVGPLDNTSALKMVAKSDIFILPCIKARNGDMDGIPTALMEAMALEIPVISTTISGIPELIENGKEGFLVKPKHVEQLANAIRILLQDGHLRKEMGKNGRKKIEKDFNIHKEVKKLINIWKGAT